MSPSSSALPPLTSTVRESIQCVHFPWVIAAPSGRGVDDGDAVRLGMEVVEEVPAMAQSRRDRERRSGEEGI